MAFHQSRGILNIVQCGEFNFRTSPYPKYICGLSRFNLPHYEEYVVKHKSAKLLMTYAVGKLRGSS